MTKRRSSLFAIATVGLLALPACMPKMSLEEMRQMRPEKPPELERLDAFVGTWEFSGSATMMDHELTFSGTEQWNWANDGWVLVSQMEGDLEGLGTMKGAGMMTYDANGNKYRSSWADNYGSMGQGTMKYDAKNDVWRMNVKSKGGMGSTRGKGCMKFVDENTIEWTWEEYPGWDWFGLFKFGEFKGTSTKQQ